MLTAIIGCNGSGVPGNLWNTSITYAVAIDSGVDISCDQITSCEIARDLAVLIYLQKTVDLDIACKTGIAGTKISQLSRT